MTINWNGKRRWIALALLIIGILVKIFIPPVVPVIQLPGEVYPNFSILGLPMTNTLMASIVVWLLLGLLIFYVARNRPQSGSEVPRGGFYNLFEMAFEGLYGFIGNIVSAKYLNFIFKVFMTIFLIVLLSNWLELIPGVDSIGFLEPHVKTDKATGETQILDGYDALGAGVLYSVNNNCPWVSPEAAAALSADVIAQRIANGCKSGLSAAAPVGEVEHITEGEAAAVVEATPAAEAETAGEHATTEATAGETGGEAGEGEHHYAAGDPSVPWVVLPFLRAPSTDLNMTAALALVAVVLTQTIGFKELKLSYLTKFFNFKTLFTSPLGGIDLAVGLLELIGELARILSFAFRLLGNIFAGSILLFVMSFLVPFLPWPFFILEFFVGALQAFVFGLLTAIFMNLATIGHNGH
ncbi:MAG TPA: F0F1 ATP synthase subunit A, partial [Phototrophicaceae bacterium]|nr:F0F1 ATP synthase subunit A [Phototrophicaceae bacterium]